MSQYATNKNILSVRDATRAAQQRAANTSNHNTEPLALPHRTDSEL